MEKFRIKENAPPLQRAMEASSEAKWALRTPVAARHHALPGRHLRGWPWTRWMSVHPPRFRGRQSREAHCALDCLIGDSRFQGMSNGMRLQPRCSSTARAAGSHIRQLRSPLCPRVPSHALCICGGCGARAWLDVCHRTLRVRGLCGRTAYRHDQQRIADRLRMPAHSVA